MLFFYLYFAEVFYRSPTKLREGNIFSRVCLSVHSRGSLYRTSAPAPSCTGPWLPQNRALAFLSPDMFKLGPHCSGLRPLPNTFKLVHYDIQTIRERAVGIRLKCLLVWNVFWIVGDLPMY